MVSELMSRMGFKSELNGLITLSVDTVFTPFIRYQADRLSKGNKIEINI